MAITKGTPTASSGANTTSYTLVINSGVQADDILVLANVNRDGTTDPVVVDNDTGGNLWTKIAGQNANTNGALTLWAKRATSGTASKTITVSGLLGSAAGVVMPYRGASKAAIASCFGTAVGEANASGDEAQAGITTNGGGSMVLHAIGVTSNDTLNPGNRTATTPATITEDGEGTSSGGSDCSCSLASDLRSAAGATGTISWAMTNGTTASIAVELLADIGGSANATQGADTTTTDADVLVAGTSSATQGTNTTTTDADVLIVGTASATQGADTVTAAGTVTAGGIAGDLNVTQGPQTATTDADVVVGVSASATHGTDSVTSDVDVVIAASSAPTQGAHSTTASAGVAVAGAASGTQGANTTTTDADVAVAGSGSNTQAAQTVSASATVGTVSIGDLNATQGAHTSASDVDVFVGASGASEQDANATTADAGVLVLAAANLTQSAHTLAASAGMPGGSTLDATATIVAIPLAMATIAPAPAATAVIRES